LQDVRSKTRVDTTGRKRHVHRARVEVERVPRTENVAEPHQTEVERFRSGCVACAHGQNESGLPGGEPREEARAARFPDSGVVQVLRDRVQLGSGVIGRDPRGRWYVVQKRASVRGAWCVHRGAQPLLGHQPRRAAARLACDDLESVPRVQRAPGHRDRRSADTAHAPELGIRSGLHWQHISIGVR